MATTIDKEAGHLGRARQDHLTHDTPSVHHDPTGIVTDAFTVVDPMLISTQRTRKLRIQRLTNPHRASVSAHGGMLCHIGAQQGVCNDRAGRFGSA